MGDKFLALLEQEKPNILKMLPGDRDAAQDERARERWWALTYELSRNPSLQKCAEKNPMSLLNAIKKFADWGLIPDGEEGFINVYNTKQADDSWLPEASPEPMYKGIIRRGVEAGVITHCVGDVLREGDTFHIAIGAKGRSLEIAPAPAKRGRKLIGGYAIYWLPNGLMDFELFDEDDIERVKAASLRNAQRKNKDAKLSPAWQYSEGEMVKAKVIKRGMKRMRGRRDTDAGRRFSEVVADAPFDLEVDGREVPEIPDDLPNGDAGEAMPDPHNGAVLDARAISSAPAGATPASGSKLVLRPDAPSAKVTDEDVAALCKQWRSLHAGKIAGFDKFLFDAFNIEDAADLTAEQFSQCLAKMEGKE